MNRKQRRDLIRKAGLRKAERTEPTRDRTFGGMARRRSLAKVAHANRKRAALADGPRSDL